MPKVTLEFEVTQTGTTVKQVVSEASVAMAGLKQSAGGATQALAEHAGATEKAGLSYRTLNMGVRDLAMAFGSTSPELTNVALGLGHVADRMSGVSMSAKLVGAGVLAAGGAVAFFFAQFQEVEKINARFAVLDRTVASLDVSALRTGIVGVNIELDTMRRGGESAVGLLVQGFDNLKRALLGIPSAAQEGTQALEYLRGALGRAVGIQMGQEASVHAGTMAGLNISYDQAYMQSLIRVGQATPGMATAVAPILRAELDKQIQAAQEAIGYQWQKEMNEAASRGTQDIEAGAILARYNQANEALRVKSGIAKYGLEANISGTEDTLKGIQASHQDMAATLAKQQQAAFVDELKAQASAGDKVDAAEKQAKMTAILAGVLKPAATQVDYWDTRVVEEEKAAKLMAIDETLQKNLEAIDKLKYSDSDRVAMISQAQQAADQERLNAVNAASVAQKALTDAAEKTTAEFYKAYESVQNNLTPALGTAAAAAAAVKVSEPASIAGNVGPIGKLSEPNPYGKEPATGPGSAEWWSGGAWGNNAWSKSTSPSTAADIYSAGSGRYTGSISSPTPAAGDWNALALASPLLGYQAAGDVPQYQEGGVVPGPVGRAQLAVVHGGETVTPPGKTGHTFNFYFGAGAVVDRTSLRRLVRENIIPELDRVRG